MQRSIYGHIVSTTHLLYDMESPYSGMNINQESVGFVWGPIQW